MPPRDGGDVHVGVVFLRVDVAVRLAERASGSRNSVPMRPSMMISASAGTRRSTVSGPHYVDRPPASPPATASSSRSSGTLWPEAYETTGGSRRPRQGIGSPRAWYLSQCAEMP